jgi:diguanylate cyclase (GGDEF)-like protein
MQKFMVKLLGYFNKQDISFFILLGVFFSILIGIIDYVTLDFFVFEFYLLPVALAVWFSGRNVGIFVAFVSVSAEIILDIITSFHHSHPWVHYSNFLLNFSFFMVIIYLLVFLKKTLENLKTVTEVEKIINKQLRSEVEQRKRLEAEIIKTQEELRRLSITDSLTGLYNRRGFLSLAEQQIKVAKRNRQDIGLIFADLDNLKWINDNLGHKEGDSVLVEVANILKESFRESDVIARIGGDEFVVIAIQARKDSDNVITARLQKNLDRRNTKAVRNYKLSLSIGVVYYDTVQPRTIDELLSAADKLMFEQKQAKRSL